MKKLVYALFTFHVSLLTINAQPSITWQKYYVSPIGQHENFGEDICTAENENFYVIGSNNQPARAYIIKINEFGDTIWTRLIDSMGAFAGTSSADGGCVFTGYYSVYPHYPFSVKINAIGNIEWFKVYENQNTLVSCVKLIRTSDRGYISCGYMGYSPSIIVKIDSLGNLQWQRNYTSDGYKVYWSIVESHNGGYFAVGYITNNVTFTTHGIIDKLNSDGDIIWEKEYSINGIRIYQFKSIDKVNENYITTGLMFDSTLNKQFSAYLRIDSAGNLLAQRIFKDSTKKIYLYDIKSINTNRYVLTSNLVNLPNGDTVNSSVYIIDSSGNVLKNEIFDGTNIISFNRILPLNNSDIMFVGNCNYNNPNFENAFVVRADSNLYTTPINISTNFTEVPKMFRLYQNFPNPFNPSTKIKFSIPASPLSSIGEGLGVRLVIYDILGREVAVLVNQQLKPGTYEVEWDGSNFASGIYFYYLQTEGFFETKKMVLMK